jgi:hypothetical protein
VPAIAVWKWVNECESMVKANGPARKCSISIPAWTLGWVMTFAPREDRRFALTYRRGLEKMAIHAAERWTTRKMRVRSPPDVAGRDELPFYGWNPSAIHLANSSMRD